MREWFYRISQINCKCNTFCEILLHKKIAFGDNSKMRFSDGLRKCFILSYTIKKPCDRMKKRHIFFGNSKGLLERKTGFAGSHIGA